MNGFAYTRLRLVAAPEDATVKAPPPAWLFKLLCKLLPPLRRRIKMAAIAFTGRQRERQLAEWKDDKARSSDTHLPLQSVAVDELDDAALARHFDEVVTHVGHMIEQHHSYHMAALLPIGDLLVQVAWSGGAITHAQVFALLTGASPISADLSSAEARQVGAALAGHGEASAILRLHSPDATISGADRIFD